VHVCKKHTVTGEWRMRVYALVFIGHVRKCKVEWKT
jgi:hypothetical protein